MKAAEMNYTAKELDEIVYRHHEIALVGMLMCAISGAIMGALITWAVMR